MVWCLERAVYQQPSFLWGASYGQCPEASAKSLSPGAPAHGRKLLLGCTFSLFVIVTRKSSMIYYIDCIHQFISIKAFLWHLFSSKHILKIQKTRFDHKKYITINSITIFFLNLKNHMPLTFSLTPQRLLP